jgi:hypothetical protein
MLFYIILISSNTLAVDMKKCRESRYGVNDQSDWYKVKKGLISSVMGPYSTTQFVSSWGECSALASSFKEKRRLFVAINIEQIQVDIALGKGEFLNAYLNLRCIKPDFQKATSSQLQKNYLQIFNGPNSKADDVYNSLEWELR